MSDSAPLPSDDARMVAWREYTATDEYRNTKRWAVKPPHTKGSLWAAFLAGWSGAESRTPNKPDLTALAKACERAATALCNLDISDCVNIDSKGNAPCEYGGNCKCADDRDCVRAHARALREGRVTVNEGGDR